MKAYAISRSVTHCDKGHEFTPANTEIIYEDRKGPAKTCKACKIPLTKPISPINLDWKGFGLNTFGVPTLDDIRDVIGPYTYDVVGAIARGEHIYIADYQDEHEPELGDDGYKAYERKFDKEKIQRELAGEPVDTLQQNVKLNRYREAKLDSERWRERRRAKIIKNLFERSVIGSGAPRKTRIKINCSLRVWQRKSTIWVGN